MKKEEIPTDGRDALDNFESQFKKSTLPMMVLQILSEQEKMYAYEITQESLRRTDGIYKMPLLYTTINKLLEQGFVEEAGKVISESNRLRVYYRITKVKTTIIVILAICLIGGYLHHHDIKRHTQVMATDVIIIHDNEENADDDVIEE